jgi:hypothetical protein
MAGATLLNGHLGKSPTGALQVRSKGRCNFPCIALPNHNFIVRSRSAFVMTETELRLMAAPAIIGLSNTPKNG